MRLVSSAQLSSDLVCNLLRGGASFFLSSPSSSFLSSACCQWSICRFQFFSCQFLLLWLLVLFFQSSSSSPSLVLMAYSFFGAKLFDWQRALQFVASLSFTFILSQTVLRAALLQLV
jgi:hypothetical protein